MMKPTAREIRPVISYVKEHWQEGDFLYLFYSAESAFEYYSKTFLFKKDDYAVGVRSTNNWHRYAKDLDALRGRERVWILFSHNTRMNGIDEEKFFLYYLNTIGTELQSFKAPGAGAHLYNLKQ
jgi:hypothetical protein